jgi:hypothetical protein
MFFLPSDLRVSDSDREAVVDFLSRHYAAGRLTDRELSDRVDAAHRAQYESQLVRLTGDLPPVPATRPAPRRSLSLGPAVSAAALAVLAIAVLAMVPGEAWAPLIALALPLVMMLVFAVGPFALPILAFFWLARALGGPRHRRPAQLPPHRGMGTFGMWEPIETRRRL